MTEIIKECGCGRSFTIKTWDKLQLSYVDTADPDPEYWLEARNCVCGSTIAIGLSEVRRRRREFAIARAEAWGVGA